MQESGGPFDQHEGPVGVENPEAIGDRVGDDLGPETETTRTDDEKDKQIRELEDKLRSLSYEVDVLKADLRAAQIDLTHINNVLRELGGKVDRNVNSDNGRLNELELKVADLRRNRP